MRKSNSFVKNLNIISKFINSLLEKNLNKLNLVNLKNISKNNKLILTFVALVVLFISYLLVPSFYKQDEISKEIKYELQNKFDMNFEFTKNLSYNLFPRPNFTTQKVSIKLDEDNISNIENMKIYVSLDNLFSLKNIKIKNIIIKKANFNFNKNNFNFFTNILENDFSKGNLNIQNSNIFFRNNEKEVLFINKIKNMKIFYDANELKNILLSENEIFNIPYSIKFFKDSQNKKFFSKLKFSVLKLQIDNELDYGKEIKTGKSELVINKKKSIFSYEKKNNSFKFLFFDKVDNPQFSYEGFFNFNPFYSYINGKSEKFDLSYLFKTNNFIAQLIKTEIFNSKNIDFKLNIKSNFIKKNLDFTNLNLYSKIEDGLIDFDGSNFELKNLAKFNFLDSLLFVKEGELVLDGKLKINVENYNAIYKLLLTPKNLRKQFNNIDLNFSYNFDRKIMNLSDIRIDENMNENINRNLNDVILKDNKLQNKIYIKNFLNKMIKFYFG